MANIFLRHGIKNQLFVIAIIFPALLLFSGCNAKDETKQEEIDEPQRTTQQEVEAETVSNIATEGDNAQENTMVTPIPTSGMSSAEALARRTYEFQATLNSVVGDTSEGTAQAIYENGEYVLFATFTSLPEPADDSFYEGWVVRTNPLHIVSTGKVEKDDGRYINTYTTTEDLTDHTRYVLTIEPNDGDPAPAEHVLEGEFLKH